MNPSLTRKQAAYYLSVHQKTLALMTVNQVPAPKGKVSGYKEGRVWRYRLSDLDAYREQLLPKARLQHEVDWGAL